MGNATRSTKRVPQARPLVEDSSLENDFRPMPTPASWRFWVLAALLVGLSLCAFWPVLGNGFVDMDDEDGFVKNRNLVEPASVLIRWAWTSYLQGVYQPLSRMMYGAEASLWGVEPKGFHGASLVLHSLNSVALFALTVALVRICKPRLAYERPGLVQGMAALSIGLFVAHPLRAEVVAWASVQAYQPAALFAMLSVLAYLQAKGRARFSRFGWLATSITLFAISLGFYAIALCLPLVLLVLDVYPLGRLAPRVSKREMAGVFLEKVPYLILSLIFAAFTYLARVQMGTVTSITQDSLVTKLATSCYGACFYLAKTLIPVGLGPVHPMPDRLGLGEPAFALSVVVIAAISFVAFRFLSRWPALAAVWASFLLLQLPTSGLVRFASTIAADRYTYITMLGGPALLTGGLCVLLGRNPSRASLGAVMVVGAFAIVALIGLSRQECHAWRDSVSIWSHVEDSHGRPEGFFESRIGRALADGGRLDEAELHLEQAVRLSPGLAYAHGKLGLLLVAKGRTSEAFGHFDEAVRLEPQDVEARLNLGYTLTQLGYPAEAEVQFAEATKLKPYLPEARANLGAILVQLGRPAEAEVHLSEALRLAPNRPGARMDLGYAFAQQRKFIEAAEIYTQHVRIHPDDLNARRNLIVILKELGRDADAQAQFAEARRLDANQILTRSR